MAVKRRKKKEKPRRRIKAKKVLTREEGIEAACRADCGICEAEDAPIMFHSDINAPTDTHNVFVDHNVPVCFDCADRYFAWWARFKRVVEALESRTNSKSKTKIARLRDLLITEEYTEESPHLDKWEKKLGTAA